MKKPKGLTKAEKTLKENDKSFVLTKLFFPDVIGSWEFYDKFPNLGYEEINKKPKVKSHILIEQLCSEIAESITGYGHSSDLLDNGSEDLLKKFAEYPNSSDDESSDSDEFYRGDHYEAIKDKYSEQVVSALGDGSFKDFESFKELYKIAKKEKYEGSVSDFEKLLKNSNDFREFCKKTITKYTG